MSKESELRMVFIFTDSIVKLNIEVEDNTKVGRIVFALEEVIQKIKTTSGPSQRFDDLVHSLGLNKDNVAIFHDVESFNPNPPIDPKETN
jgi:hypothetical protein